MEIDHIFIFSSEQGKEAELLTDLGFAEGSNRAHPGQGTVNRKFYFDNFFLELLWVHNKEETLSPTTASTHLWERSQFLQNGHSRFGLCLVNTPATDALFQNSFKYQPAYLPKGMHIDVLRNETAPQLPWTFRLPYRGASKAHQEPLQGALGISNLTSAAFTLGLKQTSTAPFTEVFIKEPNIHFAQGDTQALRLEFDKGKQQKTLDIPSLGLSIAY